MESAKAIDVKDIQAGLHPIVIERNSEEFIQVFIERSAFVKVRISLQFPDQYPEKPILIEISSNVLPPGLQKKLKKIGQDKSSELLGRPQALAVITSINNFLMTNKLIVCWKELKQAFQLIEGKGTISCKEDSGEIKIHLNSGNFYLKFFIQIPDGYPAQELTLQFKSNNFPGTIAQMFELQAKEVVRRCVCGYSPEQAVIASNPIQIPQNKKNNSINVHVTNQNLRNLKHDVNFLKQASSLREVNSSKEAITEDKRQARRQLRQMCKEEKKRDEIEEVEAKKYEEAEQKMNQDTILTAESSKLSNEDSSAFPSLFVTIDFILSHFFEKLLTEVCQSCNIRILSDDPNDPTITDPKHAKRPVRVFCGHWFHYECLDVWMTQPPFGKLCPNCNRKVYHPDWPADTKQLEREWATKKAREREISEVLDFLGDDDFVDR